MQQKAFRQCAHGSLWVEAASKQVAPWRSFLRAIADVGLKEGIQALHLCIKPCSTSCLKIPQALKLPKPLPIETSHFKGASFQILVSKSLLLF